MTPDSRSRAQRAAPWLLAGGFVALWWLERRRPLRRATAPPVPRLARNVLMGAGAALAVAAVEMPLARRVAAAAERRRLGLVRRLALPPAVERVAAFALLDYTLYLWHVLLHRVPALWRWHRVHHADPDLDVSTALRFHAAEMLWSVPWRLAQVALLGVSHATLEQWGRLTLAEVMFHHSNVRLPAALERVLGALVVTPRLHGIHHSDVAEHQHANFSSGLAAWDALHGTRRTDVPQAALTMGLPRPDGAPPAGHRRAASA